MVEASAMMAAPRASTVERGGRHSNRKTQYQDRLTHFMRYVAVAGCRHHYSALAEIEKHKGMNAGEALIFVREKYGKRPSWEQCYANASNILRGTCAVCTAETARKSYEMVKKDIETNGKGSDFVKGVINNETAWRPFLSLYRVDDFDGTAELIWSWPPEIW
jgi:hypothetical protein